MKKVIINLKNKTVGDIDLDENVFGVKKLPDLINSTLNCESKIQVIGFL